MEDIQYNVKRSLRRTIAIHVDQNGRVTVRAPRGVSDAFIEGFVASKADWVRQTQAKVEQLSRQRAAFALDSVRLLGEVYPAKRTASQENVVFDGEVFRIPAGEVGKASLIKWYKAEAKKIFVRRVAHYEALMGVHAASVRVTSAKTRWGSCSANGNVSFSWRLLMASGFSVDYVVVHELAHIQHMDHSDAFLAEVRRFFPDVELAKKELRQLQEALAGEDWD